MKKVLIIEDERDISMVLEVYLARAGYLTAQAYDGEQGIALFQQWNPALVLLDIMLPDRDGWSILKEIRKRSSCPVIMLTALNDLEHKLEGLSEGADDYIGKPFAAEEVVARVTTVLRRAPLVMSEQTAVFGSLKINFHEHEVLLSGNPIRLPARELQLLLFLGKHPNQSFDREQLIRNVWGIDYGGSDRAVDIAVTRIRRALAGWPREEGEITTIRGMGYKLDVKAKS